MERIPLKRKKWNQESHQIPTRCSTDVPRAARALRLDRIQKEPCDLYFVESQCQEKFIKIGIASNIHERLSKLQISTPYELKLLKLVKDAAHLEREIHKEFASSRVRGEWFSRSPALLELINSFPEPELAPPEDFNTWTPIVGAAALEHYAKYGVNVDELELD
jgi:hypothetical protein